jgi:ATP-binding cassette subfamily F protein 2
MPKRGNKGHRKVTKKGDSAPEPTVPLTEEEQKELEAAARTATGVLASLPLATDIKIEQFSLNLAGNELLVDAKLELNMGRRYGLIGLNGTGKSTFLKCLAAREVPIPKHIDILLVDREQRASDMTALECVIEDLEATRERLEAEAEELCMSDDGAESDTLTQIYERLEALDLDVATVEASKLLFGLGFTSEMQRKKAREFSGGWRMRIALAKALFVKPTMLLLDEPTNHLDLEACVWLEEYLKTYPTILVLVSHSQDFLNGVCTNIMLLKDQELTYYGGNYDTYVRSRQEKETNQMKKYEWEQAQVAHIKDYIARFGHGSAKLAAQAKSRQKVLDKMQDAGLTERVTTDKVLCLEFTDVGTLPPPVLQFIEVSFGYNLPAGAKKGNFLYRRLDFGVDLDSRVALVGPNGAGKSTLLNLMEGSLNPTDGMVKRHLKLRIGKYKQHLMDQLDGNLTPLEYLMKCFPENKEVERMRAAMGKFGLTGKTQITPMRVLSDGLKSRVVFAWLAWQEPHLLLLDEPTNHLDIETIDSLAEAINNWDGGMVLVSHDFRLIEQVAKEIWICENQTVSPWKGSIRAYKKHLKAKMDEEAARNK